MELTVEKLAERIVYLMQIAKSINGEDPANWMEIENILRDTVVLVQKLKNIPDFQEFYEDVMNSYVEFCFESGRMHMIDVGIFNPATALEFYRRAAEFDVQNPLLWIDMGTANAYLGQRIYALQCYENALKFLDEKNPEDRKNIQIIEQNMKKIREME